jgi:hypothetical protein
MMSAGAEWRLCASMGSSSAHGCCEDGVALSLEKADDCCAISESPSAPLPVETSVAPSPNRVIVLPVVSAPAFDHRPRRVPLVLATRARHPIPIYLQHSALLI